MQITANMLCVRVCLCLEQTCAVADVGKTRMCVHELSVGVDIGRRVRWLSSGFTASIMMWILGCSSVDMTQALTTHGTAVSLSWRQVVHAALNFSLQALKLRRRRIADHPKTRQLKLQSTIIKTLKLWTWCQMSITKCLGRQISVSGILYPTMTVNSDLLTQKSYAFICPKCNNAVSLVKTCLILQDITGWTVVQALY